MSRLPFDRYASDRDQAKRSALHQADFIIAHLPDLRRVDRCGKSEGAAKRFGRILRDGDSLTPNQYSYLDAIYEKVMLAVGLGSVPVHHDAGVKR